MPPWEHFRALRSQRFGPPIQGTCLAELVRLPFLSWSKTTPSASTRSCVMPGTFPPVKRQSNMWAGFRNRFGCRWRCAPHQTSRQPCIWPGPLSGVYPSQRPRLLRAPYALLAHWPRSNSQGQQQHRRRSLRARSAVYHQLNNWNAVRRGCASTVTNPTFVGTCARASSTWSVMITSSTNQQLSRLLWPTTRRSRLPTTTPPLTLSWSLYMLLQEFGPQTPCCCPSP